MPDNARRRNALRTCGRWLVGLLAAVGLATILVIATPIVTWWAQAYSGPLNHPKGDILIVLAAARDDRGGISFSSYWRARQALWAWQTGGFKKIVISGGEGPGMVNFLILNGVPRDAMVAEWKSLSTRENAIETARLLEGIPGKKVLLTSDFHMYRAIRTFRKVGVDVTPLPVGDVLSAAEHYDGRFPAFQTMLVETAKIVDYRLRGWM
jgi:uncharacterized SAM-binding protein YcdF (DUF218 family)